MYIISVMEKINVSVFANLSTESFKNYLESHGLTPTAEELMPVSKTNELNLGEPFLLPRQMDGDPIGETSAK